MPELEAVAEEAEGTALWPWAAIGLARAHLVIFALTGDGTHLQHAERISTADLDRLPADDADHAEYSTIAAQIRLARWSRTEQPADLATATRWLRSTVDHPTAKPLVRLEAARLLAAATIEDRDLQVALSACETAIDPCSPLLPGPASAGTTRSSGCPESPISASRPSPQRCRQTTRGALELNDAGRAVIWSGILNRRRDLDAVAAAAPDLAGRLQQVRQAVREH
ncbi:hypothetical protein ACIBL3_45765 [Kribbella sp. NPDC050124]|uniref:hypothetical protein n=1 Tax=Kribbella sp. NPDC050124 TaxID=3364114 RepID=UPI0037AE921A